MPAANTPGGRSFPEPYRAIAEHTCHLMAAALVEITIARALRETAGNLRQENADFREFLRETYLTSWVRYEAWRDSKLD